MFKKQFFLKLNHYTNDEHSMGVDKFYNTIFLIKKIVQKRVFFFKKTQKSMNACIKIQHGTNKIH